MRKVCKCQCGRGTLRRDVGFARPAPFGAAALIAAEAVLGGGGSLDTASMPVAVPTPATAAVSPDVWRLSQAETQAMEPALGTTPPSVWGLGVARGSPTTRWDDGWGGEDGQ